MRTRPRETVHRLGAAGGRASPDDVSRSEKLNSAGPVRTIRSDGAVRATSTRSTRERSRASGETWTSSRSNSAKGSGPSRSPRRKPLTASRPVKRLRSMSPMATARPVCLGIRSRATRRTISGSAQRTAPARRPATATAMSVPLRNRLMWTCSLRKPAAPRPSPGDLLQHITSPGQSQTRCQAPGLVAGTCNRAVESLGDRPRSQTRCLAPGLVGEGTKRVRGTGMPGADGRGSSPGAARLEWIGSGPGTGEPGSARAGLRPIGEDLSRRGRADPSRPPRSGGPPSPAPPRRSRSACRRTGTGRPRTPAR